MRATRRVGTWSAPMSPRSSFFDALIFLRAQGARAANDRGVARPDRPTSVDMQQRTTKGHKWRKDEQARNRHKQDENNLRLHPTEPPGEPDRAQSKV
jgi:hypothetical protein